MMSPGKITRESVHFWIYYVSLCLLVISLPASRYFLSISLFWLAGNWIAEANFRGKFKKFASNKPAIAFTLIYALYVFGLIWSADIKYALNNDLLHKLPTLFMPIIFVTSPVPDAKKIRLLLMFFIASVITVSLIGLAIRITQPGASYREASPFMPGIYLGMMVVLAAFQLPLLVKQISNSRLLFIAGLALSAWLIFFLFYLRNLSGIASFAGVSFYLIALLIFRSRSIYFKLTVAICFLLLTGFVSLPLVKIYKQTHSEIETDFRTLEEYTESGSRYRHDTVDILRENGHLVYIYIADQELSEAWNEKSELDYWGKDLAGQELRYTLYRFMSSKGLRKEGHDFMLLTDEEIRAVEKGVANYLNINRPGFYVRMYEEMMGLYIYRESSNKESAWSSSSQRIDLWKASWQAFKEHPLIGWGTGGILHAVDYGFEKNGSALAGKNMKPHNEYICILLTLGVFGLFAFLSLYSYLVIKTGAHKIYMFKIFLIVFAINFLANNSIESQVGQNLFVFFSLFYCYYYPQLKSTQSYIY